MIYIAALVAADPEALAQWKAGHGRPATATMPRPPWPSFVTTPPCAEIQAAITALYE